MSDAMKLVPSRTDGLRVGQAILEAHCQWEKENRDYGDQPIWGDTHVTLLGQAAMIAASPPAREEAPAEPVSDRYKFDDEIAWLREAARYFAGRDTKGEDRAHWTNVYNAENARKLADRLAELSSNTCQLEAPAEGDLIAAFEAAVLQKSRLTGRVLDEVRDRVEREYQQALAALRNRTSEPEAGAVAWRFPSVLQPGLTMFTDAPPKDPNSAEPLFTHPAPATADKLRVAVEALERIAGDDEPELSNGNSNDLLARQFWNEARQALAALNEQPQ